MIPAALAKLGELRNTIHYYYKGKGEELEKISDESQQAYRTEDAAMKASFAQEDEQMSKAQDRVDAELVNRSLENEEKQKHLKAEADRLQAEHQAKLDQAKIENEKKQKELLAILAKSNNSKIKALPPENESKTEEEDLPNDISKTNPTKKTEKAKTSAGSQFGKGFGKDFGKKPK